jgi:hypothetical protein
VYIQQDIAHIKRDKTQKVSSILGRPNRSYRAVAGLWHMENHQYGVSMTKIHKTIHLHLSHLIITHIGDSLGVI